jgi:hypothetical protein
MDKIPTPYKACSCRDPQSKRLLGKSCPRLDRPEHGRWYARYEVQAAPNGKRRQPRLGPFRTAEECASQLLKVLQEGPTVNEILDDYLDSLTCAERTVNNYRKSLVLVRDLIGQYRAQHLTKDDVDFMTEYLLTVGKKDGSGGLARRTVEMAIGRLRAAYELAVFRQKITRRTIPIGPDPQVITL